MVVDRELDDSTEELSGEVLKDGHLGRRVELSGRLREGERKGVAVGEQHSSAYRSLRLICSSPSPSVRQLPAFKLPLLSPSPC